MGKLLLVGCGKMGGAMLDGWLARGLAAADVVVAEPVVVPVVAVAVGMSDTFTVIEATRTFPALT